MDPRCNTRRRAATPRSVRTVSTTSYFLVCFWRGPGAPADGWDLLPGQPGPVWRWVGGGSSGGGLPGVGGRPGVDGWQTSRRRHVAATPRQELRARLENRSEFPHQLRASLRRRRPAACYSRRTGRMPRKPVPTLRRRSDGARARSAPHRGGPPPDRELVHERTAQPLMKARSECQHPLLEARVCSLEPCSLRPRARLDPYSLRPRRGDDRPTPATARARRRSAMSGATSRPAMSASAIATEGRRLPWADDEVLAGVRRVGLRLSLPRARSSSICALTAVTWLSSIPLPAGREERIPPSRHNELGLCQLRTGISVYTPDEITSTGAFSPRIDSSAFRAS